MPLGSCNRYNLANCLNFVSLVYVATLQPAVNPLSYNNNHLLWLFKYPYDVHTNPSFASLLWHLVYTLKCR